MTSNSNQEVDEDEKGQKENVKWTEKKGNFGNPLPGHGKENVHTLS